MDGSSVKEKVAVLSVEYFDLPTQKKLEPEIPEAYRSEQVYSCKEMLRKEDSNPQEQLRFSL